MQCKWCDDLAYMKQGRIWLCKKHYRFQQMRVNAKRNGKSVPDYQELDRLFNLHGLVCPSCKRETNWSSKEGGRDTVISLQHDRSGAFNFLCLSCNARHDDFEGDEFYQRDENTKTCPRCKEVKNHDEFYADNKKFTNKKTYCKPCANQYQLDWKIKNKDKQNEWRREYYHKRKESGNPIPR